MQNLSWKFYFINAAWNLAFLVLAYFTFVETMGLTLEDIATKFGDELPVILGESIHEVQHDVAVIKQKD